MFRQNKTRPTFGDLGRVLKPIESEVSITHGK